MIVLSGEQGSAKSTFSAILRALLDPNTAPLRALPREDRDLFIAASNGHVLAFDNVSGLPAWISDTLCRLATGGGFAVRQLYTDQDEVLFDAARPVILNGIEDIVTRPDLADRAVFLTLEPIPEERRRPEAELWAAFEAERPRILGVLLDAVVEGLKRLPETQLEKLPRMADFALWATACETALWPAGTFWSAYCGNRDEAVEGVIDADPIAAAVRAVMATRTEWTGTASDLLGALAEVAGERVAKSKTWPDSPRALAGRLRRAATFLRKIGIEIGFEREGRARTRTIHITTTPSHAAPENAGARPSASSASSASAPKSNPANGFAAPPLRTVANDADGQRTSGAGTPTVRANPLKSNAGTAADGADANLPPQSAPEKPGAGLEGAAMSAAEALKAARAAGVELAIDGDDLVLEASAPPPAAVLDLLSRHKAGIVALLRPGDDGWSAEDWQAFFDERAGIAEFDGGLPRAEAEARAFACCVAEWLNRNPVRSPPGRCLGCGGRRALARSAAALRHRSDRPCLAAFALLARLARRAEGRGRRRAGGDGDRGTRRTCQTISGKTEAHDGRLRIGTAERLGARHGGSLPLDRREPAAPRGLPARRLGGQLAMDARRREGRLDQSARRGRPAASHLSRAHRRRRVGGRGRDRPHRPRALPLRRRAALFHLPRRGERDRLRAARRQAARAGALFPVPALLPARPCQPERGRVGPRAAARQQDQAAPRRRSRHGRAVPAEAEGHVAADL